MLSATPFKAYSGPEDQDGSDAHYRQLMTVLRFLLDGDKDKLAEFDEHRRSLYRQLVNLKPGVLGHLDPVHKNKLESILRPVICRTERVQTSPDFNAMVKDKWLDSPLSISQGDIRTYIAVDQTIQYLTQVVGSEEFHGLQPIEYCKSSPYTLSFLHGYKVRKVLDEDRFRGDSAIRNTVERH